MARLLSFSEPIVMRSAFGKSVGADLAQNDALRFQEFVCSRSGLLVSILEMEKHEIRDARSHGEAELLKLALDPRQPLVVVALRSLHVLDVVNRGGAAAMAGADKLKGPRMRLSTSAMFRRTIRPADAERCEAVDLRECARHHRIRRRGDQLEPRFVVVAADVLGIGSVEHEQNVVTQTRAQPAHLLDRDVGSGRIVRIRYENDARPRR